MSEHEAELIKKNATLSLEIVELTRQLAAAEMRNTQQYNDGYQHGYEAALRDHIPQATK